MEKRSKIRIGFIIFIILFSSMFILTPILMSGCVKTPVTPVCGNGIIEEGETSGNCCVDVGCPADQNCENNVCIGIEKYENKTVLKNDTDVSVKRENISEENVTEKGEISPPLHIFGEASVIAETLNFKIRDYDILTKVRIISVLNYTVLESPEILLNEGDVITINFVGIENPRMLKVMELLKDTYCSCGEPICLPGCSLKEGKCNCPTIMPTCPDGFTLVDETATQRDKIFGCVKGTTMFRSAICPTGYFYDNNLSCRNNNVIPTCPDNCNLMINNTFSTKIRCISYICYWDSSDRDFKYLIQK